MKTRHYKQDKQQTILLIYSQEINYAMSYISTRFNAYCFLEFSLIYRM
jgi:hypothetical protein